ncbi:YitT family protein [Carnobacterium gallinarum]|uniref:YitT family protein n=1 Tax=Carnobacterium gallinarum TaxID=2749 RepID=UPI00068C183F|nr:YitT family protein [Carnobacterium gallinarum]
MYKQEETKPDFKADIYHRLGAAILYGMIASIGINFFLVPAKVYSSGITGLAQLLAKILQEFLHYNVSMSILILVLNLPLIFLSWKKLGRSFTIYSLVSVLSSAFFLHVIPITVITTNPLVAAIFGGGLCGIGVGICLKYGLSTGGVDIIAIVVQMATGRKIGQLNFFVNGMILVVAGFLFGWELALYSIIAIYVNCHMVDFFHTRQQKVTVTIITKKGGLVEAKLKECYIHGVTVIDRGYGLYTNEPVKMFITVVSKYELLHLETIVKEADPKAFVNVQQTTALVGNFRQI